MALAGTGAVAAHAATDSNPASWPDAGPYLAEAVIDVSAQEYWQPVIDDETGEVVSHGGYRASVLFPSNHYADLDPCEAGHRSVASFTDDAGSELAIAEWAGFGEMPGFFDRAYYVAIPEDIDQPISGNLQIDCVEWDFEANEATGETVTFASLPLTFVPNSSPLYGSLYQYTWIEDDGFLGLNAMGFITGESVTVSLAKNEDWSLEVHDTVATVADGAGAISVSLPSLRDVDDEEWVLIAVGETSRVLGYYWLDSDPEFDGVDVELTASVIDTPAGRGVSVELSGFEADSKARIVLHSAGAPIILGTVDVGASREASVSFPLANDVAGDFALWAGAYEGGFLLLNTPLSVAPATVPSAPRSVTATAADKQATVSWQAPSSNGGTAITGYTVTSSPGNKTVTVDGTKTTAKVTGLTNGTAYTFTVTAKNSVGSSAKSSASAAVTPRAPITFRDVSSNPNSSNYSAFATEIAWMAQTGITTGYDVTGGKEYRPFGRVTRDAMAAFLYRAAGEPAFTAPRTSPFVDVKPNQPFYKEITWLASTGITTGWDVGNGKKEFRPYNNITRDAMAAFLYRYADSPRYTPPANSPFRDVPKSNAFYKEITWLASTGITTGWDVSGGRKEFRPFSPITRDAMAAFLYRYDKLDG